ncbi:hypothetical protein IPM62_04165 [Candidatus Woesebacteria bacterium]|nr:MAG: hypothetical protein IPM62_04165 [Candidatus Woesebacteria bacterium]
MLKVNLKRRKKKIVFVFSMISFLLMVHVILTVVHSGYKENFVCSFFNQAICQKVPFCRPVFDTNPCVGGELCLTVAYPELFQNCSLKRETDNTKSIINKPTSPIQTYIKPENGCSAVWSNCNCKYIAIRTVDLQEPRSDCARDCINESITQTPPVFYTYGNCVIAPEKDRFSCANYDQLNCPSISTNGTGCYIGSGTDSIPGTDFGCVGTIKYTSVIIELDIPFEVEGTLSTEQIKKQRNLIESTQKELIAQIPGIFEVYKQYTLTPSLAIKANKEALEFLQDSNLVQHIQEDKPDRAF